MTQNVEMRFFKVAFAMKFFQFKYFKAIFPIFFQSFLFLF